MRNKIALALVALINVMAGGVFAQDLQGVWQGHTKLINDQKFIFQISKPEAAWAVKVVYNSDWGINRPGTAIAVEGNKIKFSAAGSVYEGQLSSDGTTLAGTWIQNGLNFPLRLTRATPKTEWKEPRHKVQRVTVEKDVEVEVLDWGGKGRPVVLLTGLGNSAHKFDDFAPKLAASYHVYGVTRRGYGASSVPPDPAFDVTRTGETTYEIRPPKDGVNPYDADRLGDDVVKVLDALKLDRPILAGHSIAGEEMTSIGLRYPKRIAGLVYMDAFYPYAYADGVEYFNLVTDQHPMQVTVRPGGRLPAGPGVSVSVGTHEYKATAVPSLAICASPRITPPFTDPATIARFEDVDKRNAAR